MTVAYPTTGIAAPQLETPRIESPLACTSCGTRAGSPREPFCAHCGSRVAIAVRAGVASVAATRSVQFAALGVIANILVGGAAFGVVYLLQDAARLTEAAVGLEALRFLLVGVLLALAIRFGIRGLRHTRDGMLRRRGWAILGLVVACLYAVLVTGSFVATAALYFFVL